MYLRSKICMTCVIIGSAVCVMTNNCSFPVRIGPSSCNLCTVYAVHDYWDVHMFHYARQYHSDWHHLTSIVHLDNEEMNLEID